MENPAPFDLNEAIRQWRENLGQSPALGHDNLDELESHLRDSVAALEAKELTAEDAFWLARKRMGTETALSAEFQRANPERVWLDRAIWMVAGSCLIGCIGMTAGMSYNLAVFLGYVLDLPARILGPSGCLTYLATLLGLVLLAWRFVTRTSRTSDGFPGWVRQNPFLVVIGVLGWLLFNLAGAYAMTLLLVRTMNGPTYGTVVQWATLSHPFFRMLWLVVLAWLLWRRSRLRVE